MLSINWDASPVLVDLFGKFSIRYYSLLFATGLYLGYLVVINIYKKEGFDVDKLESLALAIFIATFLGARIGHCLFYEPSYYLQHPLEIILPFTFKNGEFNMTGYQGLASHGGIFAVFVTILWWCRKHAVNVFDILDKVAIGGALTAVFIRLGNFMNSEILGKATNSDFGVIFKRVDNVVRHPAQLYESLAYLLIFLILFTMYKKGKGKFGQGFIFGTFFTLLFVARFFIEFVKIDQVAFEQNIPLNMGQWLSVPFIILGLIVMYTKRKNKA